LFHPEVGEGQQQQERIEVEDRELRGGESFKGHSSPKASFLPSARNGLSRWFSPPKRREGLSVDDN